jgi:hypothetical protein
MNLPMMPPRECERESEVVAAARETTREPDAALRAHLRTCDGCREAFDVARFMMSLAAETEALAESHPLPEPAQLWWKARLLQRWEAQTRATAPLDLMQRVEVGAGLIAAAVLFVMLWSELRGVESTAASGANRLWPAIASLLAPGALSSFIVGGLLLVGCLALFTIRQLLVED